LSCTAQSVRKRDHLKHLGIPVGNSDVLREACDRL
jgi:hypothetical protein